MFKTCCSAIKILKNKLRQDTFVGDLMKITETVAKPYNLGNKRQNKKIITVIVG